MALPKGSLIVNSSQGGGSKDTWVIDGVFARRVVKRLMALLARVADRLYWGARYVERAEDTARIIRAYHELVVDFPGDVMLRWEPLAAIAGNVVAFEFADDDYSGELAVLHFLIADRLNPGSIASCVAASRENLRTTREVIPREAWQTINALSHYVAAGAAIGVRRQHRDRFLSRVVDDSRRLDGVIDSTMTRQNSYRHVPARAGDRARRHDDARARRARRGAAADAGDRHRAALRRGAVDGRAALAVGAADVPAGDTRADRRRGGRALPAVRRLVPAVGAELPRRDAGGAAWRCRTPHDVLAVLDEAEAVLAEAQPIASDGHELDDAMDRVQAAMTRLDGAIHDRFVAQA